jgi:hypothetical protein
MASWSTTLLDTVTRQLGGNTQKGMRTARAKSGLAESTCRVHLAIFVEPFLEYLLDGRKTVESRFSIHRRPPFRCVRAGDFVLVKQSAGPIVAVAEVSNVWYYEMDPAAWAFIRSRFSGQLCADSEFWASKSAACYATLMQFSKITPLPPLECGKRDRRGWVVLGALAGGVQIPLFE